MKHSDHEKARVQDMTTGNPIKLILAFSAPIEYGKLMKGIEIRADFCFESEDKNNEKQIPRNPEDMCWYLDCCLRRLFLYAAQSCISW